MVVEPLVSVVTPFYNTEPYLAECIESVLAQTYSNFEYILADNCSTDGSSAIAERYAARDPRIRLIRFTEFVSQLDNYNRTIGKISHASKYCKMVQADDYIFEECLTLMVRAFQQSESIGLVSAYRLNGDVIDGSGYPYPKPFYSGKECGQFFLRTEVHFFGSQTTVMYRSSLARCDSPFFDTSLLAHADLEKALQILTSYDFGFVHQVLSFSRMQKGSITSSLIKYRAYELVRFFVKQRYASIFFDGDEASRIKEESKHKYYRFLGESVLRLPDRSFWEFHMKGLNPLGMSLNVGYLGVHVILALLRVLLNFGGLVSRIFARVKRLLVRASRLR